MRQIYERKVTALNRGGLATWCERSAAQLMGSLLLDLSMSIYNSTDNLYFVKIVN